MDIDADHETAYLDYLLGSYSGPVPAEYSPLYVALYAVEHWFARDPIDLLADRRQGRAARLGIPLYSPAAGPPRTFPALLPYMDSMRSKKAR